jgi:hypothetical protein
MYSTGSLKVWRTLYGDVKGKIDAAMRLRSSEQGQAADASGVRRNPEEEPQLLVSRPLMLDWNIQ